MPKLKIIIIDLQSNKTVYDGNHVSIKRFITDIVQDDSRTADTQKLTAGHVYGSDFFSRSTPCQNQ